MNRRLAVLVLMTAWPMLGAHAQTRTRGAPPEFALIRVTPDVYVTREPAAANLSPLVHGNTVFIVRDTDVVAIDANRSPTAARATIALLRTVTSKPVSTLVITHAHGDHFLGTSEFADSFPGLKIIATQATSDGIAAAFAADRSAANYARVADRYDSLFNSDVDMDGRPLTPARRAMFVDVRESFRYYYVPQAPTIRRVLPTEVFKGSLALGTAKKAIVLTEYVGAHTDGDAVAWIPSERVLIVGDLLAYPAPYVSGSPTKWLATLRELRALNPRVIIGGHGEVQQDTRYLDLVIEMVDSTRLAVRRAKAAGQTEAQAHEKITLDAFRKRLAVSDPAVEDRWADFLDALITAAYAEDTGK